MYMYVCSKYAGFRHLVILNVRTYVRPMTCDEGAYMLKQTLETLCTIQCLFLTLMKGGHQSVNIQCCTVPLQPSKELVQTYVRTVCAVAYSRNQSIV